MSHPNWKTSDEFPGSISLPYGIKTSHTWHEIGKILRIVNDLSIETFIELGCHVGGLASMLLPISQMRSFSYWGIERDNSIIHDHVLASRRIITGDILSDQTKEIVVSKMTGKTLIYCDGGCKIAELRFYCDSLRSGDIIMSHDFFHGWEVAELPRFEKNESNCKPEVWVESIQFLISNPKFQQLDNYLLEGTRIIGFKRV